ncbi:MAG: helix-turn-helix transcriptional regulator [Desulfarculaceae bacterium]|nr:helix-turn-helix transcriptional regulator [Desulfarculaceae bacterium]
MDTEYYNDFLRPQKIHHKLVVNLVAERELFGRVVLTRPRRSNSFTSKEILTVRTIVPYLAHALAHNNLRRKIKLKGTVLEYIEKQSSIGMLLLDESLQIVYSNEKAEEAVGNLTLSRPVFRRNLQLPPQLLKVCREIKPIMDNRREGGAPPVKQSTIQGCDGSNFSVTIRLLDQRLGWEDSRLLMVSIEEEQSAEEKLAAKIDPDHLQKELHLSRREIEVVELVFLGLKNAEIAEKLFVSEVTVKKHLQNIYEKVGVNNRTTLVNRILAS